MSTQFNGTTAKTKKRWHWRKVIEEPWTITPRHKSLCGVVGYGVSIDDLSLDECKTCLRLMNRIKRTELVTRKLLK